MPAQAPLDLGQLRGGDVVPIGDLMIQQFG
jgi:hypothetical protein